MGANEGGYGGGEGGGGEGGGDGGMACGPAAAPSNWQKTHITARSRATPWAGGGATSTAEGVGGVIVQ
eukprot:scaffold92628_cov15-Phaeocystis_antarctica.AAC.1